MKAKFLERCDALGLPARLSDDFESIHGPVAYWIRNRIVSTPHPFFLGVNGAQGSGKSTFSDLLATILREMGHNVVVCSIDDFYLTREAREQLAQNIHPLCLHRGVPGTHDIALAVETFDKLIKAKDSDVTPIPRFDKARDDRMDIDDWDRVEGSVDVVIFEGWCVGASDLPAWTSPYNEREKKEDPNGTWCKWSRQALIDRYSELFGYLNALLMIRIPSMETVHRSRWLQESKLWKKHEETNNKETLKGLMTKEQTRLYVQLFERLTEHMLEAMPAKADILIQCGESFDYALTRLPNASTD